MRIQLIVVLLTAIAYGCVDSSKQLELNPRPLLSSPISQIENLNINGIKVSNDLLVVNDWTSDSGMFQVYSFFPISFVRSFGYRGKGPYEYISPFICKSVAFDTKSLILNIIDLNRKVTSKYCISNTGNIPIETIPQVSGNIDNSIYPSISYVETDSLTVVSPVGQVLGLFYIYNKKTETKKWIDFYPKMKIRDNLQLLYLNKVIYNPEKKVIFCGLRHFDKLLFYSDQGELLTSLNCGINELPEFEHNSGSFTERTHYYTVDVCGTSEFIFILWSGFPKDTYENDEFDHSTIIVLDWNGNYIDSWSIPKSYLIAVNPQNTTLFHVNFDEEGSNIMGSIEIYLNNARNRY